MVALYALMSAPKVYINQLLGDAWTILVDSAFATEAEIGKMPPFLSEVPPLTVTLSFATDFYDFILLYPNVKKHNRRVGNQ